eukprot:COSAG04_NODE_32109_length_253_cov_0.662338_1_plen_61_part_10
MSTNVLHSLTGTLVHLSDGEGARASAMEDGCHALGCVLAMHGHGLSKSGLDQLPLIQARFG